MIKTILIYLIFIFVHRCTKKKGYTFLPFKLFGEGGGGSVDI